MIEELEELAAAVVVDSAINKGAKRYKWVLAMKVILNLLAIALIIGLFYVTFKYS